MRNEIIPYDPHLKSYARELRKRCTKAEAFLWQFIRHKRLGVEFHRQVPIVHFIVDFYCHELKLALELDGPIHDNRVTEDAARQAQIEAYGVTFLRFTNAEVLASPGVVGKIREKVAELREVHGGV